MELTNKQEQAVRIAIQRYKSKEPYTIISGWAGTGKTEIIKFIISALNLDPEFDVAYIAYTGKAAQVLQNRDCPNATTAHRLLYKSIPKNDGTFIHVPKDYIGDYKVIVVDEVSMLPKNMWDLLLSHNIYVIASGDPGQLSPIFGDNNILEKPHIFLDEIMRQAKESEIIRLSMDVRNHKIIRPFKGTEVNIVKFNDIVDGMFEWADQIICGKNSTRRELNNYKRRMIWGNNIDLSSPIVGDKIICLKNNWDKITEAGDVLVNGTIGFIDDIKTYDNLTLIKKCLVSFTPESVFKCDKDQTFRHLLIDWKLITTGEPTINKDNFKTFPKCAIPEQFDYGYCITCWKAQGSEYDKVLFFAEKVGRMDKDTYIKYLYTGITRASKRITLVL